MKSKYFIVTVLIIISIGLSLNSCSNEDSLVPIDDGVQSSLIEEAKKWHYEQTHISNGGLLSGRLSNEQRLILTPKFKEGKIKHFAGGSVLYKLKP